MLLTEAAGTTFFDLAPLIIFLPLLGFVLNIIFGRKLGYPWAGILASVAVGGAFIVAVLQIISLQAVHEGATVALLPWLENVTWINIGSLQIDWTLRVDTLSVTMMTMVTGVSLLIHIYAIGYMKEDVQFQGDPGRFGRFFVFFNLFVGAMMVLVTANNYLMMFVGWEGVGLCSYLLIGFWYEKGKDGIGNAVAGMKAFVTNRIGDFGFLMAMFLLFWGAGSLDFEAVFHWVESPEVQIGIVTAAAAFMLLGATGKSAQIPLFVWLPDAMAGPTPVSALIHAATMVTAGIYMVVRSGPVFHAAGEIAGLGITPGELTALVGAVTALFAASIAIAQFDIKRVLAYSTISQLGFMLAAAGLGAYVAAMFHLVTHAFFKALLFLSSGSVIQGVEHGHHHAAHGHDDHDFDPQDMRNMGGLRKKMPITFWVYVIGALALSGIPPLAGFFSKDEILLDASLEFPLIYILLAIAAFGTAFYMGRQVLMVFFGKARSEAAEHAMENPPVMTVPLMTLAALAFFGGVLNLPGIHTLGHWLEHTINVHVPDFSLQVAVISTVAALVAIFFGWWLYGRHTMAKDEADPLRKTGFLFTIWNNKYWIDELYGFLVIKPYENLAAWLAEVVDWRFWHDWFHDTVIAGTYKWVSGVFLADWFDTRGIDGAANGLGRVTRWTAGRLSFIQSGFVRNYALALLIGSLLALSYFVIAFLA
ncbi:MAG: NADH-quinone oxidoreductase subunit L [Anaerolineales bacterium]|jgi:NADH-quinone oxidoreductase subunit L